MKAKNILAAALVCACTAAIAQDDEFKATVNWETPGSVALTLGSIKGEPVALAGDATQYTVTETGYVYVRPAEGYILTEVDKNGSAQRISGNENYGQYCSLSLWGSDNGAEINVKADKLTQTGTLTLNIENGATKLGAYLTNDADNYAVSTFARPTLADGGQSVALTAYDKVLVLSKSSDIPTVYSVKVNGEAVEFKNYMEIPVADGDRVDVRVYEKDSDAAQTFTVKFEYAPGSEPCVASVFNQSTSQFVDLALLNAGTKVEKGQRLRVNLNEDYNLTSLTCNGAAVELPAEGETLRLEVEGDAVYRFEAAEKVYEDLECVLYVENPEGLVIRKGAFADDEEIPLGEGVAVTEPVTFTYSNGTTFEVPVAKVRKYTVSVPGKTRKFFLHVKDGYWIREGVLGNPDDPEDIFTRNSVMVENGPVYLRLSKVTCSRTAVVYYDGDAEGVRFYATNKDISGHLLPEGLESEVLPQGYTTIAYDPNYHKEFSAGRSNLASDKDVVAYLDNAKLTQDENMNYTGFYFKTNSVLKLFTLPVGQNAPLHKVNFENEGGRNATVAYDKLKSHEDLTKQLQCIGSTLVEIRPAAGTSVMLDGEALEPDADGVCSFMTSKSKHTVTLGATSGIENVEAAAKGDRTIHNLNGVAVGTDLNALPAGVYVVGGKKIIKK